MKLSHRLRMDKPWDWAALGLLLMALGFATMEDLSWWRWFEYAAAFCGVICWVREHENNA